MDFGAAVGWGVPIYLSVILSGVFVCSPSPKQLHSENEPGGAVLLGRPRHVRRYEATSNYSP